MEQNSFLRGIMFLVLAQVMVGVNIVTSKLLLSSMPVLVLLAIRFIFASLVLLPLHWTTPARKESIKSYFSSLTKRDWWFILAQAVSAGALFNCLMLTGLNYTGANMAGIITSALPAIIAVMAWLLLGEKLSAQKAFCIIFATVGLFIIAYDKFNSGGKANSFLGDFIVLFSLLPEAAYYVLCKFYSNRLPIFLTSSLLNGINAILFLPALFFINWDPAMVHVLGWFVLAVISLSSGLFYVFSMIGSKRVDGAMASLATAVMPVATVILAWIILGEQLSLLEFAGMGLVLFSIALYARR
ncbi:MAG: DMT family transporter [Gammaproteobacteria bacterium]|nr:DMT family transporter [Gammaproteobacteria bacterium]